ncbi:hypothetical protein ACH5RR_036144 [Cinchona calisaya]|uniref:Leucine zipper with capping helix domain-containing protein n=1 Tax=Cinchona calisaya TaxID=153742 RepID=A0ABD2Y4E0_9GENT
MKEDNAKLPEKLDEQKRPILELEGEIKALQSNLTLEEIHLKETKLKKEVGDMEEKLTKLREGIALVSPEERKAVEGLYSEAINQWRKCERMFKDVWDAITENSPKDLKEFKLKYFGTALELTKKPNSYNLENWFWKLLTLHLSLHSIVLYCLLEHKLTFSGIHRAIGGVLFLRFGSVSVKFFSSFVVATSLPVSEHFTG